MRIREATPADTPALVTLALAFLDDGPFRWLLTRNPDAMTALVGLVLAHGVALVAEVDGRVVGVLALVAHHHPMSGQLVADEAVWYVDPAARGGLLGPRLLKTAETWARGRGCTMLKLGAPTGAGIGPFLERSDYRPVETVYVKLLPPV